MDVSGSSAAGLQACAQQELLCWWPHLAAPAAGWAHALAARLLLLWYLLGMTWHLCATLAEQLHP